MFPDYKLLRMRTSTSRYRLRPTMVNKFTQLFQINVFLSIRWPCATIFEQSRRGFRFNVHEPDEIAYMSTEGISVSPNYRIYVALEPSHVSRSIVYVRLNSIFCSFFFCRPTRVATVLISGRSATSRNQSNIRQTTAKRCVVSDSISMNVDVHRCCSTSIRVFDHAFV